MRLFLTLSALMLTLAVCASSNRYPACPADDFGFCDRHPGEVFYSVYSRSFRGCRCPDKEEAPQ